MKIFLSLFAGIGLIFIGNQFLTAGVKQAVGTRLRDMLARSSSGVWPAMVIGIGAGGVIQSPNALAFIAVGLIGGGALTIEAASLIVIWSYIGSLTKLFAAAIDLYAVALLGLGIVGIGYYAGWDKHRGRQHWLRALLGLSLLLFGIQLIIAGAVPLRSAPWVTQMIAGAEKYYPVGFVIGAVLAVIAQGTTVAIILIGVARGGLIEMDDAAIIAAGALFGLGFSSYLQASNLHGEERQLSVLQLILKLVATAVILPLMLIEHFFGVPTILAATSMVSKEVSMQLIFLWALGAIVPAVLLLPFNRQLCRFLERSSPANTQQTLARPQYIFAQAADDPASALNLAVREQARVMAEIPTMLESVCEGGRTNIDTGELKSSAASLLAEVDRFLAATTRSSPGEAFTEAVLSDQYVNQVLRELLEATNEFSGVVTKARSGRQEADLFSDLAEPLHAMMTAASARMAGGSARDIEALIQLGRPRDELFSGIRARIMAQAGGHTRQQQEAFYVATRLFERIVWLIHRLGSSLASVRRLHAGSQPASIASEPPSMNATSAAA